jgi:hypothetical protein
MKFVFLMFAAFSSASALASTTVYPTIAIQGANVTVDNVCVMGDVVRSINPVTYCTDYSNDDGSWNCDQTATSIVTTPVMQTTNECVAYEYSDGVPYCTDYEPVTAPISMTYTVKEVEYTDGGDGTFNEVVLSTSDYTLPNCQ